MFDRRLGMTDRLENTEPTDILELEPFVAAVVLFGTKLPDGKFQLGGGVGSSEVRILDELPAAVRVGNMVYSLEQVEILNQHGFFNAEYM